MEYSVDEIKNYIKKAKKVSFPQLQYNFSLNFKSALDVVGELCKNNIIKYIGGLDYEYIDAFFDFDDEGNGGKADIPLWRKISSRKPMTEEDVDEMNRKRMKYLEYRQRMLSDMFQHRKNENDGDDKEEEDDNTDDDSDDDTSLCDIFSDDDDDYEEDETERDKIMDVLNDTSTDGKVRAEALRISMREGYFSRDVLQREMNLDYITYSRLYIWFGIREYFSRQDAQNGRYKMLIDKNLFDKCCREVENNEQTMKKLAAIFKNNKTGTACEGSGPAADLHYIKSIDFRNDVLERIREMIRENLKITRANAILMARGCLFAAKKIDDMNEITIYDRAVYELESISNYMFNQFKKSI